MSQDLDKAVQRLTDAVSSPVCGNYACSVDPADLRLLLAAQAEGAPAAEGKEDAFVQCITTMLGDGLKGRTHDVWERAHSAGLRAALNAYRSLSHTPAPAAEPVAWRMRSFSGSWISVTDVAYAKRIAAEGGVIEPLYASPPQPVEISREGLGEAIYLAMYEHHGAKWSANESQDVWIEAGDRLRSKLSGPAR